MSVVDQIKNSAKKNGTRFQSTEASELERILNRTFYLPKDPKEETAFVKQVMTRGLATQERVGLHASSLIVGEKDFCIRAQVLSLVYKQLQGEQIQPGLMRIFEQGNAIHEKWQRLFIRGGYGKAHDMDFTQYSEKYMISYTPDIICTIEEFLPGQKMIGEIKSVNTFQFQRMDHHPSAGKQLQWYMHLSGIHKGFVLSEDKNNQDFKLEVYDYDPEKVQIPIERAEQIQYYYKKLIEEHKMVPKPADATSSSCKRCEKCAMRDACWNVGIKRVKLEVAK